MRETYSSPFSVFVVVFLIAVLVVVVPLLVVRIRRARRYAHEHPAEVQSV